MNTTHRIRRLARILAAGACALLALATASPAMAATTRVPHYGPPASGTPAQLPAQTHTVVQGGMPGWQIALIAAGTAVLAALLAVTATAPARPGGTRPHRACDTSRSRHSAARPAGHGRAAHTSRAPK